MATHSRDRVKRTQKPTLIRASRIDFTSFVYTKWFAYSGVATFVLSLIFSWYVLSPAPADQLTRSDEMAVDLERDRENSKGENDPEQWSVNFLAEAVIVRDMDPAIQPINDVGSEYISLIDEI